MSKNILEELRRENKKAFIPFVVVGAPTLDFSEKTIDILIEEGADLIELGVPFSDAMADGPVIQFASEKASENTSLADVLKFAEKILKKHPNFPFVLFTYYNPILKMGISEFSRKAKETGIYAILVVDLPPEESEAYLKATEANDLKTVYLASPTTSQARLKLIDQASTAFIYCVSRVGVTGAQNTLSATINSEIESIRKNTKKPIAVGFGISTGTQARQISQIADAVVVGSAFVKLKTLEEIRALAKEIRSAIFA